MRGALIVGLAALAASAPAFAQSPLTQSPPVQSPPVQADESDMVDARIRASAEAAESLQGPLDGAWTLVTAAGQPVYAFQLVDKPGGRDPLEGVWRDLRRPQVAGDIGMIDSLSRGADFLSLSFSARPGDPPVRVELKTGADGRWSGQLREGAATTAVTLRRG